MNGRTVIGNWKQNLLRGEAAALAAALREALADPSPVRVGVAPTLLSIDVVRDALGDAPIAVFAQDVGAEESGANTGEIGPAMLADAGVHHAIVGHSERRAKFGDGPELVRRKLECALNGGLEVVLCVGESLDIRDAGDHESFVISQLSDALSNVNDEQISRLSIAYEPVWAIGTGKTATPTEAGAMHTALRRWLDAKYAEAAAGRPLLYGGSVKPGNAASLCAAPHVDGFLVGGASLDPTSFTDIVRHASAES